jgi:acetamidase/formamidase
MRRLKQEEYCYTIGPYNKSQVSVKPGETIIVTTADNTGNKIKTGNEYPGPPLVTRWNPLSGPIYVENAKKGDTLEISIKEIEIAKQGWTGQSPRWGTCMSGGRLNPMLNEPIPAMIKICPIKGGKIHFPTKTGQEILIPTKPLIGTIGTSPELEAVSSSSVGSFGGNMDCPDVCSGNKLYLPVFVEGALVHLGDVHAVQGHGEFGGAAVEVSAECTLKFEVIKGKSIAWPRIEGPDFIMTLGNWRPVDDCLRIATTEMVQWLNKDYGFDLWDANMLITSVGEVLLNQSVNAQYSVGFKFPKKYLLREQ